MAQSGGAIPRRLTPIRWAARRGGAATQVAIDSNALTYLIDAMAPEYEPARDASGLAVDRIAMIRIRLYAGIPLAVLPTVEREYRAIRQDTKRTEHARACAVLLDEGPWQLPPISVASRAEELAAFHNGGCDCHLIAEAEASAMEVLLTCDGKLRSNLRSLTPVRLLRPSELFESFALQPGARPVWEPSQGNPLGLKSWWRL